MAEPTGFLEPLLGPYVPWVYVDSLYWTAFGIFGNVLFSMRFLIQWLYSEKKSAWSYLRSSGT
ncbi:lipid-A-disaccharide synthase N-terminal domain-containing protein [Tahibacter amnicola]|uniref:Lipid-A-disaccharide synthase N-terminal domain-containing protein n=1 Tax=Tahibacter amnicola TaxID=2976241 RepID=A0ABY6B8B2_9GAMM|nr:lipid-A-disaccharide synthase N-terminal domain-containing protein [Tahibacter amnicola]UXI66323.1 lipid-A-disaccharide synthase N-terminal domain-containing protein [Tahibacter amnicola]